MFASLLFGVSTKELKRNGSGPLFLGFRSSWVRYSGGLLYFIEIAESRLCWMSIIHNLFRISRSGEEVARVAYVTRELLGAIHPRLLEAARRRVRGRGPEGVPRLGGRTRSLGAYC